jgi:hypothetical protein
MPEAPWWSTPGATAVLPQEAPPAAPPLPPAPPRSRRPGTAGLLALALVVGGAAGGGVATLLQDDKTVVSGTTALDTRSLGSVVKGTPEAAAASGVPFTTDPSERVSRTVVPDTAVLSSSSSVATPPPTPPPTTSARASRAAVPGRWERGGAGGG